MKTGLVGYGRWGRNAARALARVSGFAMIADPSGPACDAATVEWSPWGVIVTDDPQAVFDRCEAVWIATPTDTHQGLVEDALQAGCHVMCEKPFVRSAAPARALVSVAEGEGLALMVDHLALFTGQHQAARAAAIPEWTEVRTVRRNTEARPSDSDVLWGLGPHDVACLLDVFGDPREITCAGTEHRVEARLCFSSGIDARMELDWLAEERMREFRLGGIDYSQLENPAEPLLLAAATFAQLCAKPAGRQAKYEEAIQVTDVLERLDHDRAQAITLVAA